MHCLNAPFSSKQVYLDGLGVSATSPRRAAQRGIQWRHTLNPDTPRQVRAGLGWHAGNAGWCADAATLKRIRRRSSHFDLFGSNRACLSINRHLQHCCSIPLRWS